MCDAQDRRNKMWSDSVVIKADAGDGVKMGCGATGGIGGAITVTGGASKDWLEHPAGGRCGPNGELLPFDKEYEQHLLEMNGWYEWHPIAAQRDGVKLKGPWWMYLLSRFREAREYRG